MSDVSGGPGWWQASDLKWYAPDVQSGGPAASASLDPNAGAQSFGAGAPLPGASLPGASLPGPDPMAGGQPLPGSYAPAAGFGGPPGGAPPGYGGMPGGGGPGFPGGAVGASTSGLAVVALILSIIWLGGLGDVLAIIFGLIALSQIKAAQGMKTGKGLAVAGMIIGTLGLVATVALYAAIGLGVHAINKALTPQTVAMGQAGTYSGGSLTGLSSVTVNSFTYPVTPADSSVTPSSGNEFAVAHVQECAASSQQGGNYLGSALFLVNLSDGNTVSPDSSNVAQTPSIDRITSANAGQCVNGTITFQIPQGSTPSNIEYLGDSIFHPYRWTISGSTGG